MTTLARFEAEGALLKARRVEFLKGRNVRVFSEGDIEQARGAFPKRRG